MRLYRGGAIIGLPRPPTARPMHAPSCTYGGRCGYRTDELGPLLSERLCRCDQGAQLPLHRGFSQAVVCFRDVHSSIRQKVCMRRPSQFCRRVGGEVCLHEVQECRVILQRALREDDGMALLPRVAIRAGADANRPVEAGQLVHGAHAVKPVRQIKELQRGVLLDALHHLRGCAACDIPRGHVGALTWTAIEIETTGEASAA